MWRIFPNKSVNTNQPTNQPKSRGVFDSPRSTAVVPPTEEGSPWRRAEPNDYGKGQACCAAFIGPFGPGLDDARCAEDNFMYLCGFKK